MDKLMKRFLPAVALIIAASVFLSVGLMGITYSATVGTESVSEILFLLVTTVVLFYAILIGAGVIFGIIGLYFLIDAMRTKTRKK